MTDPEDTVNDWLHEDDFADLEPDDLPNTSAPPNGPADSEDGWESDLESLASTGSTRGDPTDGTPFQWPKHKTYQQMANNLAGCAVHFQMTTDSLIDMLWENNRINEWWNQYTDATKEVRTTKRPQFETVIEHIKEGAESKKFDIVCKEDQADWDKAEWEAWLLTRFDQEWFRKPSGFLYGTGVLDLDKWKILWVCKLTKAYFGSPSKSQALQQMRRKKQQRINRTKNIEASTIQQSDGLANNQGTSEEDSQAVGKGPSSRKRQRKPRQAKAPAKKQRKNRQSNPQHQSNSDASSDSESNVQGGDLQGLDKEELIEVLSPKEQEAKQHQADVEEAEAEGYTNRTESLAAPFLEELKAPGNEHRRQQRQRAIRLLSSATKHFFKDFKFVDIKGHLPRLQEYFDNDDNNDFDTGYLADVDKQDEEVRATEAGRIAEGEGATFARKREEKAKSKNDSFKDAIEDGDVYTGNPTETDIANAQKWQALTNSPRFQRDNLKEALHALGITSSQFKCLRRQNPAISLRWWQVIAIHTLYNMAFNDPVVTGGLCADSVGTGKTFIFAGIILHTINRRREEAKQRTESGLPPLPFKPFLVLAPPSVLDQIAGEFYRFSSAFTIRIYHSSVGSLKMEGARNVKEPRLQRGKGVLDDKNRINASTVVFSSYPTMAARHGPNAAHAHLKRKAKEQGGAKKSTKLSASDIPKMEKPSDWPEDLAGAFELVICDEATDLRNISTYSTTVKWLNSIYLMFTATPAISGPSDFCSYLSFVEKETTDSRARNLKRRKKPLDPFLLPDDHADAVCRYCSYSWDKWIERNDDISPDQASFRRQEVLSKFMLRRDYQSSCPIGNKAYSIAKHLPEQRHRTIDAVFSPSALEMYKRYSGPFINQLFHAISDGKGDNNNVIAPNPYAWRALGILSFCPLLGYLHDPSDDTAPSPNSPPQQPKSWFSIHSELYTNMAPFDGKGHLKARRMHWLAQTLIDKGCTAFDHLLQNGVRTLPDEIAMVKVLDVFVQFSPRLQVLLNLLANVVILRREKLLCFSNSPFIQEFLCEVFAILDIEAKTMTKNSNRSQRKEIIKNFNDRSHPLQVFNGQFSIGGVGLNLQKAAHVVLFFDPPPNAPAETQALGRVYRIGQLLTVYVFNILIQDSFDQKRMHYKMEKSLEPIAAMIDWSMLREDGEELTGPGRFKPKAKLVSPHFVVKHVTGSSSIVKSGDEKYPEILAQNKERQRKGEIRPRALETLSIVQVTRDLGQTHTVTQHGGMGLKWDVDLGKAVRDEVERRAHKELFQNEGEEAEAQGDGGEEHDPSLEVLDGDGEPSPNAVDPINLQSRHTSVGDSSTNANSGTPDESDEDVSEFDTIETTELNGDIVMVDVDHDDLGGPESTTANVHSSQSQHPRVTNDQNLTGCEDMANDGPTPVTPLVGTPSHDNTEAGQPVEYDPDGPGTAPKPLVEYESDNSSRGPSETIDQHISRASNTDGVNVQEDAEADQTPSKGLILFPGLFAE